MLYKAIYFLHNNTIIYSMYYGVNRCKRSREAQKLFSVKLWISTEPLKGHGQKINL